MKKRYEIVNHNWMKVFVENTFKDLETKMIKLNSVTTLTSEYNSYGESFRISFLVGGHGPSIVYLKTEEQEYKRDLAFFEGILTKL